MDNSDLEDPSAAVTYLLSPEAVRSQCGSVFELAEQGKLEHFDLDLGALERAADHVTEVIKDNYPDLQVPFHARWRHFVFNGEDRYQSLMGKPTRTGKLDDIDRARMRFDLAITSVLLDAGAGPQWAYDDKVSGDRFTRSEGLALASLDMFAGGGFSSDLLFPLQADGYGLMAVSTQSLAKGFQVSDENPLSGLEGRAALINALGRRVMEDTPFFKGTIRRPGNLVDYLLDQSGGGAVPAREILIAILHALGPIWSGRLELNGVGLGDTWPYTAAGPSSPAPGYLCFHKLSQWLSYSLIEPLQEMGVEVFGINDLTGLAEYRNGGLFIDHGVLRPKPGFDPDRTYSVGDALILEWRAMTVALLDRIAPLVRERLGKTADEMPLAAILEGGTWAAGRRVAAQLRAGGGPPINIQSDGSVF